MTGLAAQGIDPRTGKSVGGYIVSVEYYYIFWQAPLCYWTLRHGEEARIATSSI